MWDRQTQEYPILKELADSQQRTITELEKSLAIAQERSGLSDKELELQKKIDAIKDMEIAALKDAFEREKDITDRAIKLAEAANKKNPWWVTALAAIGGLIGGAAIAK